MSKFDREADPVSFTQVLQLASGSREFKQKIGVFGKSVALNAFVLSEGDIQPARTHNAYNGTTQAALRIRCTAVSERSHEFATSSRRLPIPEAEYMHAIKLFANYISAIFELALPASVTHASGPLKAVVSRQSCLRSRRPLLVVTASELFKFSSLQGVYSIGNN